MKSKVALTRTGNRSRNVDTALRLLGDDIELDGVSRLFIKVNFVSTETSLAATHVDAVQSLLRFLRERYSGHIAVGEATLGPADDGFKKYGYLDLSAEFDVELVDLNKGDWEKVEVYNSELKPMTLHYSRQLLESDYIIAIGPPKTHDSVVVTLSVKNLAMGGLSYHHGDKRKMHQGYPVHNLNLYLLNKRCSPDLSIIDGFTGMEGKGPIEGEPVDWGVAFASTDPVAADSLAARLMGYDISDIGYLWYCGAKGLGNNDMSQIEVLGEDPESLQRYFRPHPDYEKQKHWRDDRISKMLEIQMVY